MLVCQYMPDVTCPLGLDSYENRVMHTEVASFPDPTQLSVMEKWERTWYFSHVSRKDGRKNLNVCCTQGPEQQKEPRYLVTYHTYLANKGQLSYRPNIEHV